MITCKLLNEDVQFEATIYLDNEEIQMIDEFYKKTEKENIHTPDTLKWMKEEKEFKEKGEKLAKYLEISFDEFAEVFIRVIALGELKGSIICTQEYKEKEEFIRRLYEYFEEFNDPEYKGHFPPDFFMNVFCCLNFYKFNTTEIRVPQELLLILLNIRGEIPDFNNPPEVPEMND